MKKQISFPKIDQFRNVIRTISQQAAFTGMTDTGEPIYDGSLPKPIINFTGTVKLHGTNAGVSYNTNSGLWAQARTHIVTPLYDNAGFAAFVETHADAFKFISETIAFIENVNLDYHTVTVYGEWCGSNIQKGVAIANISKSFFIFAVKVSPFDETIPAYWLDLEVLDFMAAAHRAGETNIVYDRIHRITDFPSFSITIDFNNPKLVQNTLAVITKQIEDECPVAKSFGFSGIGEGAVWSGEYKGTVYRFKVKGEKHSVSKVITLAAVDIDKLNSVKEFIEYAVTDNRFAQSIENVFTNGADLDIKQMGDVIRWMVTDITKEELDVMDQNGLIPKDVNKAISVKVKNMFMEKYNARIY